MSKCYLKSLSLASLFMIISAGISAAQSVGGTDDLSTFTQSESLAEKKMTEVNAKTGSAGWSHESVNITWSGSGVKKEFRGVSVPMEAIYTGTAETIGNIAFTCYAGALTANVAFVPMDMGEMIKNPPKTKRAKLRRPDIKIDGEFQKSTDWIYVPKFNVYRTRRPSTAAKLYNSVIRQSDVDMREQGKDYIPIELPPVDRVFAHFGSECGIGKSA